MELVKHSVLVVKIVSSVVVLLDQLMEYVAVKMVEPYMMQTIVEIF